VVETGLPEPPLPIEVVFVELRVLGFGSFPTRDVQLKPFFVAFGEIGFLLGCSSITMAIDYRNIHSPLLTDLG
jgi:hypothetical protein